MGHATTQREVEDFPSEQRAAVAFRWRLRKKLPSVDAVCGRPRLDHAAESCYLSVSTSNPPGRAPTGLGSRRRSKCK